MKCLECDRPTTKNSSYCASHHPSLIQMPQIREREDDDRRGGGGGRVDSPAPDETPTDRTD